MGYLTAEEKERLQNELNERIGNRAQISDRIGRARELGDLKENADYHAAREEQGLNEAKIRELEEKISTAIVAGDEIPKDMAFIGSILKLKCLKTNQEDLYKLVGEATGSFDLDYIEVTPDSALGKSLMKTRVGDKVSVHLPRGEKNFEILDIS